MCLKNKFKIVCDHLYVCICVNVCVCVCRCVCRVWISSPILLYLSFSFTKSLTEPRAHQFVKTGCSLNPMICLSPTIADMDYRHVSLSLAFDVGACDVNSGFHSGITGTLPSELSLQPIKKET